jgi:AraC-like DNA-binding protein
MAQIASRMALSERQLERLFRERIGLAPKVFARIARLRYAGRLQTNGEAPSAAVALRAGYADQAHFVRECRSLFGVTPAVIARERRVGFVQSDRPDAR